MNILEKADFEATLAAATTLGDVTKLLGNGCEWLDWDNNDEMFADYTRAIERAIELVSNVEEGTTLFANMSSYGGSAAADNLLLNRLVDLIGTEEDLNSLYHELAMMEDEIKRRNIIRRIFDKADELGIETI